MDFNLNGFDNLVKKIQKYASGKLVPSGVNTLRNHQKDLRRYIGQLRDYDMQGVEVRRQLKEGKDALNQLELLIDWYDENRGNSKEAQWRKEFYELGKHHQETRKKKDSKPIKIIRIKTRR